MDNLKIRTEIKDEFLKLSIEHGKAYKDSNYQIANKLHKELHKLYDFAKQQGQDDIFSEMLDDSSEYVKLWAAIFTLKMKPKLAENVLKDLSVYSKVKMTATTTLHLWKEGKLELL